MIYPADATRSTPKVDSQPMSFRSKVGKVANQIFTIMTAPFVFPLRYIGAKNWSLPGLILRAPVILIKRIFEKSHDKTLREEFFGKGIRPHAEKRLTPEETEEYLPAFASAACVHRSKDEWITPLGYGLIKTDVFQPIAGNIEAQEFCFFDPKNGLKIAVMENNDEVIIAFGALGSNEYGDDQKKLKNHVRNKMYLDGTVNLLGGNPGVYDEAAQVVKALLQDPWFKGKKVTLTGQSYGGAIASYVALKNEIPAICINALPMGVGLQWNLGSKKLQNAERYIRHVTVEGDPLGDLGLVSVSDRILSVLGVRTPGLFGRRYSIPSAYKGKRDTHDYAMGSMMQHLGQTKKTKPQELPDLIKKKFVQKEFVQQPAFEATAAYKRRKEAHDCAKASMMQQDLLNELKQSFVKKPAFAAAAA